MGSYQKIKLWIPPVIWASLILLASSISGDELPRQEIPHLDKVVHLGIYGILGFLLARTPVAFWVALTLAALFGLVDEFYQSLTPGRSPDPVDWIADVAGAFLGVLFYRRFLFKPGESSS